MTDIAPQSSRPPLRDRLLEMRRGLLDRMAAGLEIEVAWLNAIAGINAALAAIDDEERNSGSDPSGSETRQRRGRGHRTAKTVDGLQKGNLAIARLREQYFGDFGITRAGDEIAAEGRRYETTGWRFDRQKKPAEIGDERRQLLAEVLRGRRHFPGSRQVRGLLSEMNSAPIHFLKPEARDGYEDLDH